MMVLFFFDGDTLDYARIDRTPVGVKTPRLFRPSGESLPRLLAKHSQAMPSFATDSGPVR
jgi:hypothetical protein